MLLLTLCQQWFLFLYEMLIDIDFGKHLILFSGGQLTAILEMSLQVSILKLAFPTNHSQVSHAEAPSELPLPLSLCRAYHSNRLGQLGASQGTKPKPQISCVVLEIEFIASCNQGKRLTN